MDFDRSRRADMQQLFESNRQDFLTAPLPLYGLDASGTGLRATGDWERDSDGHVRIGLGHGDPRDKTAPHVQVLAVTGTYDDLAWTLHAYIDEDPTNHTTPETVDITMTIDAVPTTFQLARGRNGWVAQTPRARHGLIIEADNTAPASLNILTVTDLEPYLAGRRRLLNLAT